MLTLAAELTRVQGQKDALLNLRLNGEVDQVSYARKNRELAEREERLKLESDGAGREQSDMASLILRVFELSQSLKAKWVEEESDAKRRLLEIVCLNLKLQGATLVPEMRSPFDVLAEGLICVASAQDRI